LKAAYNSFERYSEHASTCSEGTQVDILRALSRWTRHDGARRICWLQGHVGTGKSTIAHTIAKQLANEKRLAFSFFFSRRSPDRSDIAKFFPTFAFQLACFLPPVQEAMQRALEKNPAILYQGLDEQFAKLIVEPVLAIPEPVPSMTIVIDGLDEYDGRDGRVPLKRLISLLVDGSPDCFPFRFLLTSRPEAYIREIFDIPSIHKKTHHLALQDFKSRHEVYNYLRSELLEVQRKRKLPENWLLKDDLEKLSERSDGLYIYAITLIRFIDNEYDPPQQRLQDAVGAHNGVDCLYDQVLRVAQKYSNFDPVFGAIMSLCQPLAIDTTTQLLQRDIRQALRGCLSILIIPDRDGDYIRPYHASLQDYLVDPDRSKNHFLDPVKHNRFLMGSCVGLITAKLESDSGYEESFRYASRYWCHHFRFGLSSARNDDHIEPDLLRNMEGLMDRLWLPWLVKWMRVVGSHSDAEQIREDLRFILKAIMVSQSYLKTVQVLRSISNQGKNDAFYTSPGWAPESLAFG
jgi:hypothetical protein